jgi:hypothetical protein
MTSAIASGLVNSHTTIALHLAAFMPDAISSLRVTGTLSSDARLGYTSGHQPEALLMLQFSPARGLPYYANVKLGHNPSDHIYAEQMVQHMRAGTVVSVAAAALELRMDHSHATLRLIDAHSVWVFEPETKTPPKDNGAQPALFSPSQH